MSYIRSTSKTLKDGTERKYYYRVEGYREGGKVKQRVVDYLGIYPNRITMNVDAETAASVASVILQLPSQTEATKMLRKAGIPVRGKPGTVSIIYNPPLRGISLGSNERTIDLGPVRSCSICGSPTVVKKTVHRKGEDALRHRSSEGTHIVLPNSQEADKA